MGGNIWNRPGLNSVMLLWFRQVLRASKLQVIQYLNILFGIIMYHSPSFFHAAGLAPPPAEGYDSLSCR